MGTVLYGAPDLSVWWPSVVLCVIGPSAVVAGSICCAPTAKSKSVGLRVESGGIKVLPRRPRGPAGVSGFRSGVGGGGGGLSLLPSRPLKEENQTRALPSVQEMQRLSAEVEHIALCFWSYILIPCSLSSFSASRWCLQLLKCTSSPYQHKAIFY